jgi:hypothetical protein
MCAASVRVAPLSSLGASVSLFRKSRWSIPTIGIRARFIRESLPLLAV